MIAVEAVDLQLGRLLPVIASRGALIVTADHGNCDDDICRERDAGRREFGTFDESGTTDAATRRSDRAG